MIRAIVEPVLGSLVLWKRRDASKSFGSLIVDVLAERTNGDTDLLGHLFSFRTEVIITAPHEPLIELEDIAIQFKEIHNRIVVLKAVHSPDLRGLEGLGLQGLPKHRLEAHNHLHPRGFWQWRLVLGRHLAIR